MKRRPKWLDRPEGKVPEYLRKKKMTGKGVSDALVDRAFWLGDNSSDIDQWVTALQAIDKRADKKPLLNLLKSDRDLSKDVRLYLADLLERYELKKPKHRPPTPAYDRTDADAMLLTGVQRTRDYVNSGMSVKDALAKASKQSCIPLELLGNAYEGRRGSTRRMRTRRTRP